MARRSDFARLAASQRPRCERAIVVPLRYSGLRMQDAACLERHGLKDGRLFLYTQKTGTPVYPLPPGVIGQN